MIPPLQRIEYGSWQRFEPAMLTEMLSTVAAVNGELLEALADSARSGDHFFPLPESLRCCMAILTSSERQVAARCGVFLADAALADLPGSGLRVEGDLAPLADRGRAWLPIEQSISLAHSVLLGSWYLIHASPAVARVLLGISAVDVTAYRARGVGELAQIARRHSDWIRPRWPHRLDVWTQILERGSRPVTAEPRSTTLRCMQVSAGDPAWRSTYVGLLA
jgi:hypothetical protein